MMGSGSPLAWKEQENYFKLDEGNVNVYMGFIQKVEELKNVEQKLLSKLKKFVISKVTTNGYTLVKLGF